MIKRQSRCQRRLLTRTNKLLLIFCLSSSCCYMVAVRILLQSNTSAASNNSIMVKKNESKNNNRMSKIKTSMLRQKLSPLANFAFSEMRDAGVYCRAIHSSVLQKECRDCTEKIRKDDYMTKPISKPRCIAWVKQMNLMQIPETDHSQKKCNKRGQILLKKHRESQDQGKPLCLTSPMFGQHANRLIELANGLRVSRSAQYGGSRLALSAQWSAWYTEWFDDDIPDIMLIAEYDAVQQSADKTKRGCRKLFQAKDLYYKYPFNKPNPILYQLLPKKQLWDAAKEMYDPSFVSVHRRWHPHCVNQDTNFIQDFCAVHIQPHSAHQACRYTESFVKKQLKLEFPNGANRKIVSFSDNSWFSKTNQFQHEDSNQFHLQMVLMSISHVHYGNPASSIDYVVQHWRKSDMQRKTAVHPEICFGLYQQKYKDDWRYIEDTQTCISCGSGQAATSYTSTCQPCSMGKYQSESAATSYGCKLCPSGKYNNEVHQSRCKTCQVPSYQNEMGQDRCKRSATTNKPLRNH